MPISIDSLRRAGSLRRSATARTLAEARTQGLQTAFLCHSHKDEDLVQGLINMLQDAGWRVYVDWADASMPETPTRETASKIKQKIVDLSYFLFLATPNSMESRWCPWEIGYADGKKLLDKLIIIPTTDQSGRWHGSEYLQLYRKLDAAQGGGLGVWEPGQTNGLNVRTL